MAYVAMGYIIYRGMEGEAGFMQLSWPLFTPGSLVVISLTHSLCLICLTYL